MSDSVPLVTARSGKEIDEIAFKLVEAFQPEAVGMLTWFDVERYMEFELKKRTGVEPVYRLLGEGLEGFISIEKMLCVICEHAANHGGDDVTRRRLRATQAHEVGHCHLHVEEFLRTRATLELRHDKRHADTYLYRQDESKVCRNPEWQAWRFAGALLMPEPCLRRAVDCKWTLQTMSRAFDVNPSFVEVRLRDLRITKRVKAR
jgi:hypothetical protein